MNYTENFNLNLPETTDQFRVDHQNENMRKIDEELIRNASQMEAGRMTAEDKKKLDGIDAGANNTVVDSELSTESENPVQNKVIANELENIKSDVSTTYLTKTEGEEIKKSVSDGKSEVASSITTMGVATAADATFHTMATNILAIESGIGELPLPITTFTATVQNTVVDLAWTLPTDSLRSGVEIWYKKTNSFGDTPSGTKAYDSNTMLGTTTTSCSYDFGESETDFYATIYSYAYINNQRCYTKGKTIQFHTKQVKGFQKFLSSGTFTVPAGVTSVDVFLVGGGSNGATGVESSNGYSNYSWWTYAAGNGGNGGKILTQYCFEVTPFDEINVTIGGSNGGATTFGDLNSNNGTVKASGGKGAIYNAGGNYIDSDSTAGADGVYAFDDDSFDGVRYAAGGGGGGTAGYYSSPSSPHVNVPSSGGTTGGGAGGTYTTVSTTGYSAVANTGSGGGGGGCAYNGAGKSGGSGGSGICIIRWGY